MYCVCYLCFTGDICIVPATCFSGEFWPDPTSCQKYNECNFMGKWVVKSCVNGSLFDNTTLACVPAATASCVNCLPFTGSTTTVPPPGSILSYLAYRSLLRIAAKFRTDRFRTFGENRVKTNKLEFGPLS